MISFFTKTLKVGICTVGLLGLAGAAGYAVVGKDRTHAVVSGVHGQLLEAIDGNIENPTALRTQLREMEKEYPKRIAQVHSDLAEIQAEIRGLEREEAISERVVALADQDLERMHTQLEAQGTPAAAVGTAHAGEVQLRAVVLDDRVYSPRRAKVRVTQVENTRLAYANRAADARHDLLYLQKQAERLEDLLAKLEGERAEFQTQILNLSREIDSIARNDRLIGLLEKRNRTLTECSRYEAMSLDQITGRLASIRTRQEAELDLLSNVEEQGDYEDLARRQLASEDLGARATGYAELPAGF